jgi:hypothetical protein
MRTLLILTAIIGLSASAFAQTAKSGKLKQVKPSAPMGVQAGGNSQGHQNLGRRLCGPFRASGFDARCRALPASRSLRSQTIATRARAAAR